MCVCHYVQLSYITQTFIISQMMSTVWEGVKVEETRQFFTYPSTEVPASPVLTSGPRLRLTNLLQGFGSASCSVDKPSSTQQLLELMCSKWQLWTPNRDFIIWNTFSALHTRHQRQRSTVNWTMSSNKIYTQRLKATVSKCCCLKQSLYIKCGKVSISNVRL